MWTQGEVCELTSIENKTTNIKVKFLNDVTVPSLSVSIDSEKIAPYSTKREPEEWRSALTKGDKIDAMDKCGTWYESTVIEGEIRPNATFPTIKVGFRYYDPSGTKVDEMGTYNGFSEKADEHIGSFTNRI